MPKILQIGLDDFYNLEKFHEKKKQLLEAAKKANKENAKKEQEKRIQLQNLHQLLNVVVSQSINQKVLAKKLNMPQETFIKTLTCAEDQGLIWIKWVRIGHRLNRFICITFSRKLVNKKSESYFPDIAKRLLEMATSISYAQ